MASSVLTPTGSSVAASSRTRLLIRTRSSRVSTLRPAATAFSPPGRRALKTSARTRELVTSGRRRRRYRRRATDSASRTASLTIADESRYVAAISVLHAGAAPKPPREIRPPSAEPTALAGRPGRLLRYRRHQRLASGPRECPEA